MPRVPDGYLDCVIYLYPSLDAARDGEAEGGTGFLVAMLGAIENMMTMFVCAVTNSHVIRAGHAPVIRVNSRVGGFDLIELSERQWIDHPQGDDLAVAALGDLDESHAAKPLIEQHLVTRDQLEGAGVGIGDEVFMTGRFKYQEGQVQNVPVARFGTLAVSHPVPIWQKERTFWQESFLVECRSLAGFSGSPVYLNIPPNSFRDVDKPLSAGAQFGLLGVDWGHIPDVGYVVDEASQNLGPTVRMNSGMTCVIPAWKLAELLHDPEIELLWRTHERKQWSHFTANGEPAGA
jgi:hypothetical protein